MPGTLWTAPVGPLQVADGTNPGAATTIVDTSPQPPSVIAQTQLNPGTKMRIRAEGNITSTSATPTMTLGFYWGGVAGTAIATISGVAISASATSWPWIMEWFGNFRVLDTSAGGTTGTIIGQGRFWWPSSLTAWASAGIPFPTTAAARTVSVNTTGNNQLALGCTFSSTTGTPTLTCNDLTVELGG